MAQDILNLDEESFERILEVLSRISPALREHYNRAVEKVSALTGEWDDEDYQVILQALKSVGNELDDIDELTGQMNAKVRHKLEMIRARRNIEF